MWAMPVIIFLAAAIVALSRGMRWVVRGLHRLQHRLLDRWIRLPHWVAQGIAIVAATNTAGYALTSYMPTYLSAELGVGAAE